MMKNIRSNIVAYSRQFFREIGTRNKYFIGSFPEQKEMEKKMKLFLGQVVLYMKLD